MKRKSLGVAAIIILAALGYFVYANLISQDNPCGKIFKQTTISLETKIDGLKKTGEFILSSDQFEKLSDQSRQITGHLTTCCVLFHEEKITFEEFLKCQDEFNQYERDIACIGNLVDETHAAKQQERYDVVNLRLKHLDRNLQELDHLFNAFQVQMKSFRVRPSTERKQPTPVAPKTVLAEEEPNDSYKQAMEIPIGILSGTLSSKDQYDYFRFELASGSILNLAFTPDDESEFIRVSLQNFEGDELWNSGEIAPGAMKSTRMMMNSMSGGIYYVVIHSGIGQYTIDLFIEAQNDAGSGSDAGDKITQALEIQLGHSYIGELGGVDEEDWYRFDIPAGHILLLAFTPNERGEAMKFSLRSFERSEVWYSGVVPPGTTRQKRVMMNNSSGGTYYLEASFGSGSYKFAIFSENQNDAESRTDAGDTIAEALRVQTGQSYSGELGGYDEQDWYRFDVPPGSILKMAFTTFEGGNPMKFSFHNVERDEVWHSDEVEPGVMKSTRVMTNNASGGTYFLEASYGSGPYGFEIFTESQNDAGSGKDAGDKIAEAFKIKPGFTITGELGGLDKEDWYTFSPRSGQAIQFTIEKDGEPLKLSFGNVARREVLYAAELTPGKTQSFEIPQDVQPPYFLKVHGGSGRYRFEIK